jgi:hypothetical protein
MFVRNHKSVLSTDIQKMEAEENIGQVSISNAPFSGELTLTACSDKMAPAYCSLHITSIYRY